MTTVKITDHVPAALDRLLAQFKEKPRIEGAVSSGVKQIQDLENAAFALYAGRSLQTATGRALDRFGEMLLEARGLQTDDEFRAQLFFKVSKNISNGTPEEIIKILLDLVQGDAVQYTEQFPGKISLTVTDTKNNVTLANILAQMQQLLPAGVSIKSLTLGYNARPFAFAGHPDLNARGFDTFPVEGTGGQLVSIVL